MVEYRENTYYLVQRQFFLFGFTVADLKQLCSKQFYVLEKSKKYWLWEKAVVSVRMFLSIA